MAEMDEISMAFMPKLGNLPSQTLAGRRERETRMVAPADRRMSSTRSTKDRQLNLKVTAEFYDRVSSLSKNADMSMPRFIEAAVDFFATHRVR